MQLTRQADHTVLLSALQPCDTFLCRLRGLMFRASIAPDEGLLFVFPRASRLDSAIHMLFMRFPIAVVWLDDAGQVVDTALAKPWRLVYAPSGPARYVIEAAPALLERVSTGDILTWNDN